MIRPADFFAALRANGLTFFAGVPDSLLKDLCTFIDDNVGRDRHVIAANEGGAVAVAAGHHLATGEIPVIYLQNSGIGNAINPLLSLIDPAVYRIPMLLIIGWRGEPGTPDEPQHVAQGRVMPALLAALDLKYDVLDSSTANFQALIARAADEMRSSGRPHALLVRRGTFEAYLPEPKQSPRLALSRCEAIETVLSTLQTDDIIVSTTGLTSREVFAYREVKGQGHHRDFLTVGSMGHCSQIAMGIAAQQPKTRVVCLDGDGSVIMHMGSMAIIGTRQPANLLHVVVNNGAHDSVGGQPTAGLEIDLCAVALACGYTHAESQVNLRDIAAAISRLRRVTGPSLLELRVQSDPTTDAGRPTVSPLQNKLAFMEAMHDR